MKIGCTIYAIGGPEFGKTEAEHKHVYHVLNALNQRQGTNQRGHPLPVSLVCHLSRPQSTLDALIELWAQDAEVWSLAARPDPSRGPLANDIALVSLSMVQKKFDPDTVVVFPGLLDVKMAQALFGDALSVRESTELASL